MVLIEGLGDEVTLVLGSFVLVVVLLFAWLSTHTEDIPLIREVGVIVVELRQRTRNRPMITDQPQENEISQHSREGIVSEETPSAGADTFTERTTSVNEEHSGHSTLLTNELSPISENITQTNIDSQPQHQNDSTAANVDSASSSQSLSVDSQLNDSSMIISSPSFPVHQPDGELLRRRRVQYFETGVSSEVNNVIDTHSIHTGDNLSSIEHKSNSASGSSSNNNLDCDISSDFELSPAVPLAGQSVGDNGDGVSQQILSDLSEKLQRGLKISSNSNNEGVDNNVLDRNTVLQSHDSATSGRVNSSNNVDNKEPQSEVREGEQEEELGSSIRVRLKYMNETQRFVDAKRDDTIGDFRRTHFQTELQEDKWVRFIFNGQDLRDDNTTLQAYNIENNCTMHCLVTSRQQTPPRQEATLEDEEESIFGTMMYPLFTVLLLIVWYFRIFYRQYFSAMSTVCLIGISFLLGLSYISSLRTADNTSATTSSNGQHQQARQPSTSTSSTLLGEGNRVTPNHPHLD